MIYLSKCNNPNCSCLRETDVTEQGPCSNCGSEMRLTEITITKPFETEEIQPGAKPPGVSVKPKVKRRKRNETR